MRNSIKKITAAFIAAAAVVMLAGCSADNEHSDKYRRFDNFYEDIITPPAATSTVTSAENSEDAANDFFDNMRSAAEAALGITSDTSSTSNPKSYITPDSSSGSDDWTYPSFLDTDFGSSSSSESSISQTGETSTDSEASEPASSSLPASKPVEKCECRERVRVCVTEPTEDHIGEIGDQCTNCGSTYVSRYSNYFTAHTYRYKEEAERALMENKADRAAQELVDQLGLNSGGKSDLEKLCVLKKWFCDNTSYDFDSVDLEIATLDLLNGAYIEGHEAYDILIDHKGVCDACAKALCLILPKCGIDTYYCRSGKIKHAWNIIKVNGQWTYTDFVGGEDDGEDVILGSSYHGVPDDVEVKNYSIDTEYECEYIHNFDFSVISTELRLFDLNGKELEVHKEANGYSYVDSNGDGWIMDF